MDPESLYRMRTDLRMNREQFAESLGVTTEEVIAWETGTASPSIEVWFRIDKATMCNSIRDKRDILGWFYVIQLIPDMKPERLKFGFSKRPVSRLSGHRVSSPTAAILKTYPSAWADETPCIAAAVNEHCIRLTTEAYDVDSIDRVLSECDRYYEWITSKFDADEYAELLEAARYSRPSMERFAERLDRIREDWLDLH